VGRTASSAAKAGFAAVDGSRIQAPVITILIDLAPDQDYHVATIAALDHASRFLGMPVEVRVVPTDTIQSQLIAEPGAAVVVGPGSPYRNREGVLAVIRSAREKDIPLVGT
jgi:CTP synthase (UTP-ammonia lyase)